MERLSELELSNWLKRDHQRPLVIRGARQVGKSTLVQSWGKREFAQFWEVNFEHDPLLADLFTLPIQSCIQNLERYFGQKIIPKKTLLFIDEVQEFPQVFRLIRSFAELVPDLKVILTGSLLDFTLKENIESFPVGRAQFLQMYPMNFHEFLLASNKVGTLSLIQNVKIGENIPNLFHTELRTLLSEQFLIGGMPAALKEYLKTKNDMNEMNKVQKDILASFYLDFYKYKTKVDYYKLLRTFQKIPSMLGKKCVFKNIDPESSSKALAHCLSLLDLAGIAKHVYSTKSSQLPLEGDVDKKFFKVFFLDSGLAANFLSLKVNPFLSKEGSIDKGGLAEQWVFGELRHKYDLYYWARDKSTSQAEVDFVINDGPEIIPIEVKSGGIGHMKSLMVFLDEKPHVERAVRLSMDISTPRYELIKSMKGRDVKMLSLPLYLAGEIHRFLEEG